MNFEFARASIIKVRFVTANQRAATAQCSTNQCVRRQSSAGSRGGRTCRTTVGE